jgi:hypothetical protein
MDMALPPDLTLFVGADDEWVVWSRSGYYDTSPQGGRRVGYHVNRGADKEALFFPADRFKAFDRPDIIKAIVEHGSEDLARAAGIDIAAVDVTGILPPIVEFAKNGVAVRSSHVTLTFTTWALSDKQPVKRVWILKNERFAWAQVDPPARPASTYKVRLRLTPGRNVFTILAETATAKSLPVVHEVVAPQPEGPTLVDAAASGNLYLLSVGVSEFEIANTEEAGDFETLKFAHKDAIAVYNAFAKSRRSNRLDKRSRLRNRAFDAVEASLLVNESATKDAILRELHRLCERIAQRNEAAGAERDVLMVFLSGHGVQVSGRPDLYFWNYDLHISRFDDTALSLVELGEIITSVPAEVVLMVDACHSALAGGSVVRGLDAEELARRVHAVNERGMYVLNASRSEELASEDDTGGQGVFTGAILDTLSSSRHLVPDAPGSKRRSLSMAGLIAGIQEGVPRITAKAGADPQIPVCRIYGDLLPLTIYRQ